MGQNQVKGEGDTEAPLLGVGANGEDSSGRSTTFGSPLHLAASSGNLEKVEELLNNWCDDESVSSLIHGQGENGRTPLHCATLSSTSSENLTKVIELLLQRDKEDPASEGKSRLANRQDASGKTALHYAAESEQSQVVSLLLKFGADPNLHESSQKTALHYAAASQKPQVVSLPLQVGADPNLHESSQKTSLHYAAASQKPQVVSLLLKFGADPNLQDASQKTALHYAAASRKPGVVSLLLKFRADPNLKDAEGSTPFHILAESNSDSALECAELILASPSLSPSAVLEKNSEKQTAAFIAVQSQAPKLLKLFVISGFDVESPDKNGYTPLFRASNAGDGDSEENLECVKILLNAYTAEQVNITVGWWEITALHEAAIYNNLKVLELLVGSPKAELFAQDNKKKTVFHYAVNARNLAAVTFLCKNRRMKANNKAKFVEQIFHSHKSKTPEEKEIRYESPIEIALRRRYTKIAEYLLEAHPDQNEWMKDDELMSLIYSKHPTALLPTMDDSITRSTKWEPEKPEIYFKMITGVDDSIEKTTQETKYLYQLKNAPQDEQKDILLHPLVQIFLEEKWRRMQRLIRINTLLHGFWILCYTLMVYEIYAPDCHNADDDGANHNQTESEGNNGGGGQEEKEEEGGKGHIRILSSLGFRHWEEDCKFNQAAVQTTAVAFYVLSAILLLKEVFLMVYTFWDRMRSLKRDRKGNLKGNRKGCLKWDWKNLGLEWTKDLRDYIIHLFVFFANILVAVINSAPAWQLSSASELVPWQTNLAAMGILVAWIREVDNFPKSGIYSTILKTVLWNCLKTMLFYCPLLIGFAMCLRLLSPGKGQHKYLLFSLVKIAAMMTGELDLEDAFYGEGSGPSLAFNDILGQIVFLMLVFVTTIVVLNLLTGLAVKDVGRLLKEADFQRLSLQLDRVHMLESLLLSTKGKLVWFDFWKNLPHRFNLTSKWDKGRKEYFYFYWKELVIAKYSKELQERIQDVLREKKEK